MHLLYTNLFLWKIYFDNFSEKFSKMSSRITPAFSSTTVLENKSLPKCSWWKKCENYKSQSLKNWFSNHQKVKIWRLFNLLYRELTQSKLCRPIESALQLMLHLNYWQLSFTVSLTSPHLQETLYNACFCFSSLPYTQKNYKCSLS